MMKKDKKFPQFDGCLLILLHAHLRSFLKLHISKISLDFCDFEGFRSFTSQSMIGFPSHPGWRSHKESMAAEKEEEEEDDNKTVQ